MLLQDKLVNRRILCVLVVEIDAGLGNGRIRPISEN
jgi:hypothetical protein